jgi:cyclophilin family peptidyl-prolyl cis-trans isomerase
MRDLSIRWSYVALLCSAATLVACGGGSSSTSPALAPVQLPAVAAVTGVASVAPLSYSKSATLAVNGVNLDQGIVLTAPGCSGLVEAANPSPTQRRYTCTLTAAGSLAVEVKSSAGASLFAASLPVPDPQVTVVTSAGTMVLELNPARAPLSVDNFLKYTTDGFYSSLIFHRVISSFVIQAGGFGSGLVPKATTYGPIKLESTNGLKNLRGTLGMARNLAADTATSQFYINTVDNAALDYVSASQPGYAVFGKVVDGLPVVDAIRAVPTTTRSGLTDVPVTDVTIVSATQTR